MPRTSFYTRTFDFFLFWITSFINDVERHGKTSQIVSHSSAGTLASAIFLFESTSTYSTRLALLTSVPGLCMNDSLTGKSDAIFSKLVKVGDHDYVS